MNRLHAVITSIETENEISLVVAQEAGLSFYSLVLGNASTAGYLQEGKPVILVCKESAVSVAKGVNGLLSIRNRISCTVSNIETGHVLSAVSLACKGNVLTSVITTNAVKELNLQVGDKVEALIKTTDISLMQPEP